MAKKLAQLKAKRKQILSALDRIREFIDSVSASEISSILNFEIQGRFEKLSCVSEQFEAVQSEIEIITDLDKAEEEIRVEFENTYFGLRARIQKLIEDFKKGELDSGPSKSDSTILSQANVSPIHLPLMKLPVFCGDYDKWLEFRDSFVALVEKNPSLSNIQKFYHLRSCLQKEGLETIKAIPISDVNYRLAWELLIDRYERSHLIANNHVNSILHFSRLQKESSQELRSLYNCIRNNLEALKNLGAQVQHWDMLLIPIISGKLDPITRREWEKLSVLKKEVSVQDLLQLINNRCEILERFESNKTMTNSSSSVKQPILKQKASNCFHVQSTQINCKICGGDHRVFQCDSFLKLNIEDRIKKVKEKGLCLNCLKPSHMVSQCQSSKCKKCGKLHNTLLHKQTETKVQSPQNSQNKESPPVVANLTQYNKGNELLDQVVLPTAIIFIRDSEGNLHRCRAILDTGSSSNFMTNELCNRLGIQKKKIHCSISGVGQVTQNIQHTAEIKFKSINGASFQTEFLIIDKITSNLPLFSFNKNQFKIPKNIKLADPNFNKSDEINILLGSSIFWEVIQTGQLRMQNTNLILQETKLGWIVGGNLLKNINKSNKFNKISINCLATRNSLEKQIQKFWEIEEVEQSKTPMSAEDKFCEEQYLKTHKRGKDGRFIVKIPFKPTVSELGHSRDLAKKRFEYLERRLLKNKDLYEEYKQIFNEYKTMGHMRPITEKMDEHEGVSYYIPHHAVIRKDSITTKTRIVFDASMKTTSGLSLNDVQYVGPSIQNEIFSTLLNFRLHKYIICSDISKMYRMIWLSEEHKPFHRIFWRENPQLPLECFELQTVTFGTASAPFLAIRCLNQLANENEKIYPKAAKIIKNNFYVDDLIYGAETINELVQLQHEISSILSSAGFHLRKWLCNNDEIYTHLKINPELDCNTLQFSDKTNKTLGVSWNAIQDEIIYKNYQFNNNQSITKRVVLSELAKVFDPLGLLGPILIVGKLLMQSLWKLTISWDEELPQHLLNQWLSFRKELSLIHKIKFNRRVLIDNYSSVELHGFCDASEKAYGACLFITSKNQNGEIITNLLCSKSRVAPLKSISLPKLELCGALLLSRLTKRVTEKIEVKIENIHYWTDSTIALAWIRSDPQRWKTFVANRVSEIQTLTNINNWSHISSLNNPCDILSRGSTVDQLINHQLWWSGPTCLHMGPSPNTLHLEFQEIPEQRAFVHMSIHVPTNEIIDRYSSFERVVRITAYCLRFKVNCQKTAGNRIGGELGVDEIKSSSNLLFRLMQIQSFPDDYNNLKLGKCLSSKSKLLSLNPFIDKDGLIRVGGRLERSNLNFQTKHPIIIDPKHRLTKLLLRKIHFDNFHCGPTMLLSLVRQNYWPLNGRNLVKGITRKCTVCFLAKPKPNSYLMGQLPTPRLSPSFPFENVGIDYAGPILLKDRKTRNYKVIKGYICLFVCLATKAIHLEAVTELTTEGFFACLNRFMGRRGRPNHIYTDNAKNFVGANSEIKKFYEFIQNSKNQINKFFVDKHIEWHFIPARSPTFGGIWEAGIKGVKYHLVRVMRNNKFHYEELCTILCQIESILNSRPLTLLPSNPTDLKPLTPGHFLIARSFLQNPECTSLSVVPTSRLRYYEHLQTIIQHFWKRWSLEYITDLQTRTKWKTTSKSQDTVQVGKVVLVKDDGLSPYNWPLGRITEVHPGSDGVVRVVSVKLRDSIVKRGVNKICVLPEE